MRSYVFEIKPVVSQYAHKSQLKPFVCDGPEGENFLLRYFCLSPQERLPGENEWQVEKILQHKTTAKGLMFLTKWEGFPVSEATWEPINHFIHRYAAPWVAYCRDQGWQVEVLPHLSVRPKTG